MDINKLDDIVKSILILCVPKCNLKSTLDKYNLPKLSPERAYVRVRVLKRRFPGDINCIHKAEDDILL